MATKLIKKCVNGVIVEEEVEIVPPTKEEQIMEAYAEIESLKFTLSQSDYKTVKNSECFVLGEGLPYDAEELHIERQALRDKINELEEKIAELQA